MKRSSYAKRSPYAKREPKDVRSEALTCKQKPNAKREPNDVRSEALTYKQKPNCKIDLPGSAIIAGGNFMQGAIEDACIQSAPRT